VAKSDAFEAALQDLIYLNIAFPNIGDATGLVGSTVAGFIYFALHAGDPGEGGNQSTNEIAYTGYTRVGVARGAGGFVRTANSISPLAAVTFPTGTGGSGTATFFSTGIASAGSSLVLHRGLLVAGDLVTPLPIVCGNGVTPRLGTGTAITEN
jgi:hypothetical protein